jgi:hypothetical protein
MAPSCVLYLAVEDVLVPRSAAPSKPSTDAYQFRDSPHATQLTDLLTDQEHVGVVVNSVWVAYFGFRYVLDLLPYSLRHRVIGATVPGNRMLCHRRLTEINSRCACLAADVRRREPALLTVLESDARHVPVPLRDDTVIVPRGLWAAQFEDWTLLRDKLARTV